MSDNIFIVDTDALIHAYRYDFPPKGNHGGFWEWLNDLAKTINIVIPEKVYSEIIEGNDGLAELLNTLDNVKKQPTSNVLAHMPRVLDAYGKFTEVDLEIIDKWADPYVIANAIELNATVVTNEISEPGKTAPRNKKIPDICSCLDIKCVRYPHFIWEMRGYSK